MVRIVFTFAVALLMAAAVGCGSSELQPTESSTPQVDQAEIQRQIEEGMKQGGMTGEYEKHGATAPSTSGSSDSSSDDSSP